MKIYIITIFLFLGIYAFGQEIVYDIHNTTLEDCIKFEETIGSELIPTTSNHISFSGEAQPIKFKRLKEIIPDLIVFYKFKESDSTLISILYEWDVSNFDKRDNNKQSAEIQEGVKEKYYELKSKLLKEFQKVEIDSNYSNIARLDPENIFEQSCNWEPNDSTSIELYSTVSNFYKKEGASTINPVHRIRLYIKNKERKKEPPILDDKRKSDLDSLTFRFFDSIKKSEFEISKELLSDAIRSQATEEVLKQIYNSIEDVSNFELSATGIQYGMDGKSYTILNYSRIEKDENTNVNNFKVVFNDKNEIVSLK